MMDLLMRLNERLSDTEQALEKALQEKQGESTSQPPEVTRTVITAPPTGITTIPSTVPASTAEIIIGETTTCNSITMTTEQLIKAM